MDYKNHPPNKVWLAFNQFGELKYWKVDKKAVNKPHEEHEYIEKNALGDQYKQSDINRVLETLSKF